MSQVMQGGSGKVIGIILALVILAILGGLSYFNASQQKGITNSIGIIILLLPIFLIVIFVKTGLGHRMVMVLPTGVAGWEILQILVPLAALAIVVEAWYRGQLKFQIRRRYVGRFWWKN